MTMIPQAAIRDATIDDLNALVEIHHRSLPDDFLVRLGPAFLRRVFFPTLFHSPRCHIYVAESSERVVGLLVTRMGVSGVLSEMLRHKAGSMIALTTFAMLRRPGLVWAAFSVLRQLSTRAAQPSPHGVAELFLLAVDPQARRRGIGRALIQRSAQDLQRTGISSYQVRLHAGNVKADALYAQTGFVEKALHDFAGVLWKERQRDLTSSTAPQPSLLADQKRAPSAGGRRLEIPTGCL